MLALPSTKYSRVIAIVFSLIVIGSYGILYLQVKDMSEGVLAGVALVGTNIPAMGYMAEIELHRKVRSGESDGSDALYQTLMLAHSKDINVDRAFEFADDLLALGIDLNLATPFGGTLLHKAVLMNQPEIVVYLLERCADPGVQITGDGTLSQQRNALEYAYYVDSTIEDNDYSRVIEALENPILTTNCSYN